MKHETGEFEAARKLVIEVGGDAETKRATCSSVGDVAKLIKGSFTEVYTGNFEEDMSKLLAINEEIVELLTEVKDSEAGSQIRTLQENFPNTLSWEEIERARGGRRARRRRGGRRRMG